MFEYTALVDAPVQRFTGIVTGAEPDDEPVIVMLETQAPLDRLPGTNAQMVIIPEAPVSAEPMLLVQAAPEVVARPEPIAPAEVVARPEPTAPAEVVARPEPTAPAEVVARPEPIAPAEPIASAEPIAAAPVFVERRAPVLRPAHPRAMASPAPGPSLVPALVAIAAAGITAMWWLRKDGHDRSR